MLRLPKSSTVDRQAEQAFLGRNDSRFRA